MTKKRSKTKSKNSFGMDYAVPGVLGGLGQGYSNPNLMYFGNPIVELAGDAIINSPGIKETLGEMMINLLKSSQNKQLVNALCVCANNNDNQQCGELLTEILKNMKYKKKAKFGAKSNILVDPVIDLAARTAINTVVNSKQAQKNIGKIIKQMLKNSNMQQVLSILYRCNASTKEECGKEFLQFINLIYNNGLDALET